MRKVLSISLDSRIRPILEQIAVDENRSLSSVVEILLMEHFSIPRKRHASWVKADEGASTMEFSQEEANVT